MNKTLKMINEGFDKKYLINEAQQQPQKTISAQKRSKIENIIRNNLEGKISYKEVGHDSYSDSFIKEPYLFTGLHSVPFKNKSITNGVIRKGSSFRFDPLYSGVYDITFDKQLYDKLTEKTVDDIKNFLNSQNIQFDSVEFQDNVNQHIGSDPSSDTVWTNYTFNVYQHDAVETDYLNKVKSFDDLYIDVPEWYRIKERGRTLCFGGIDKAGFIRVNAVIDQGVQGGTQVTFPSQEEAENFIALNGYQYARTSKSKATDQIVPVKTQNGYAYATKRFIKQHETSRYPLPVIDYDVHASVNIDWDLNDPKVFTDDDFDDY